MKWRKLYRRQKGKSSSHSCHHVLVGARTEHWPRMISIFFACSRFPESQFSSVSFRSIHSVTFAFWCDKSRNNFTRKSNLTPLKAARVIPSLGHDVVSFFGEDFMSLMSIDDENSSQNWCGNRFFQHKQGEQQQHPAWHHAPIIRIHNLLFPIRCPLEGETIASPKWHLKSNFLLNRNTTAAESEVWYFGFPSNTWLGLSSEPDRHETTAGNCKTGRKEVEKNGITLFAFASTIKTCLGHPKGCDPGEECVRDDDDDGGFQDGTNFTAQTLARGSEVFH